MDKWIINLLPAFTLHAPDGSKVHLKSKRQKDLLAALVINGAYTQTEEPRISRRDLLRLIETQPTETTGQELPLLLTRLKTRLNKHKGPKLFEYDAGCAWLIGQSFTSDLLNLYSIANKILTRQDFTIREIVNFITLLELTPPRLSEWGDRSQSQDRLRFVIKRCINAASNLVMGKHRSLVLSPIQLFCHKYSQAFESDLLLARDFLSLALQSNQVPLATDFLCRHEVYLNEELGIQMDQELESLFHLANPDVNRDSSAKALFGRSKELNKLTEWVKANRKGILSVIGIPGIGVSTLLIHFEEDLRKTDTNCLTIGSDWAEADCSCAIEWLSPSVIIVDRPTLEISGYLIRQAASTSFPLIVFGGLKSTEFQETLTLGPVTFEDDQIYSSLEDFFSQSIFDKPYSDLTNQEASGCLTLAQFTMGIPSRMVQAASMAKNLGIESFLIRLMTELTNKNENAYSLWGVIRAMLNELNSGAQTLILLLSRIKLRIPSALLANCPTLDTVDQETALSSGLVRADGGFLYTPQTMNDYYDLGFVPTPNSGVSNLAAELLVSAISYVTLANHKVLLRIIMALHEHQLINGNQILDKLSSLDSIASKISGDKDFIDFLHRILVSPNTKVHLLQTESICSLASLFSFASQPRLILNLVSMVSRNSQYLQSDLFNLRMKIYQGLAQIQLGNFQSAQEVFIQACTLSSRFENLFQPTIYYNLGICFEEMQDLKQAQASYAAAKALVSPQNSSELKLLIEEAEARMYHLLGHDPSIALGKLKSVVANAMFDNQPIGAFRIMQNIGRIYLETGLLVEAVLMECFGSIGLLSLNPTSDSYRLSRSSMITLATCLIELGVPSLALKVRTLIDRMEKSRIYSANIELLDKLLDRTFTYSLRTDNYASVEEIAGLLDQCISQLEDRMSALNSSEALIIQSCYAFLQESVPDRTKNLEIVLWHRTISSLPPTS